MAVDTQPLPIMDRGTEHPALPQISTCSWWRSSASHHVMVQHTRTSLAGRADTQHQKSGLGRPLIPTNLSNPPLGAVEESSGLSLTQQTRVQHISCVMMCQFPQVVKPKRGFTVYIVHRFSPSKTYCTIVCDHTRRNPAFWVPKAWLRVISETGDLSNIHSRWTITT